MLHERDTSTVQAAADAFLSSWRYANPNTRRGYTDVLDRPLAGLGTSRPLAEVTQGGTGREPAGAWAVQAENNPSPSCAASPGLPKGWAAVTARLTPPYSSGAVEGHVNRVKMTESKIYGRAKPDPLHGRLAD